MGDADTLPVNLLGPTAAAVFEQTPHQWHGFLLVGL
jgi:hypothetical protein